MKKQKGITLIALVITIIVLLILAGVTIATLQGNNSAPQKATEAAQKDAIAGAKDEIAMETQEALLNYYNNKYVSKTSTGASGEAEVQSVVAGAADTAVTNAKSRNKELLSSSGVNKETNVITLETKSFTVTGTIDTNGGITWSDSNSGGGTGATAEEVNALIGKTVEYSANGITSWRVFYAADGEMFIIPSGMANTSFSLSGDSKAGKYTDSNDVFSTKNPAEGSTATYRNVEYGKKYNSRWYNQLKNGDTMNIDVDSSSKPTWRSRATAYLCDPANWTAYVSQNAPEGTYAVGGPTKELLVLSWNEAVKNGGEGAPTTAANWAEGDVVAGGYLWNKPYELSNSVSPYPISSGILSSLYNNGSNNYWLASPSSSDDSRVCLVSVSGYVGGNLYSINVALRPLVLIPLSNVKVENGTVTIKQK